MGEAIWCNVRVKVPTTWNKPDRLVPFAGMYGIAADAMEPGMPDVIDLINDALINGSYDVEVDGAVTWWHVDGEGNYGLHDSYLESALTWLENHGVPYRATDDPKYEFSGTVRTFDGITVDERTGDADGNITLTGYEYERLKAEWAHAPVGVVGALDAYFALPDWEGADISHLPATEPVDDEEEVST